MMLERIFYKLKYRYLVFRQAGKVRSRSYATTSKRLIGEAVKGVGQEAKETEEMAHSFFRLLEHKLRLSNRAIPPTEKEVKEAIEQLKDVARFSIFATISIIPGGGFSLIGLEILAKKFGVKNFTFIPSSFRKTPDGASEKRRETKKIKTDLNDDKV